MRSCLISRNKVDWQEGHCMNTLMLSNISGPTNNHPGFRKYFPVQLKLSSWTSVGCYLEYLDQFWYICDKVLVLIRFSNMNKENKDKSDIYILGYDQSLNLTLPPPSDAVSALTRFIGRIHQQGGWQGGCKEDLTCRPCVFYLILAFFRRTAYLVEDIPCHNGSICCDIFYTSAWEFCRAT